MELSPNTDADQRARLTTQAQAARAASRVLATLPRSAKDALLLAMARKVVEQRDAILTANAADVAAAEKAAMDSAKLRRLVLTASSLAQLSDGLCAIADLPDPIGEVTVRRTMPNGLDVSKVRAPLGVVAMIYEARPAVTLDAFALCLKSGNACILKGGKEARQTIELFTGIAHESLAEHMLPHAALISLCGLSRAGLAHLLTLNSSIDLVIPRGGTDLIRFVAEHTSIPTVAHYQGVCHMYIDSGADPALVVPLCLDSKITAPAACNALECILLHEEAARWAAAPLVRALLDAGVSIRACPATLALLRAQHPDLLLSPLPAAISSSPAGTPCLTQAREEDFGCEFLDMTVAMATVASMDAAIEHIERYGSNHTDVIISSNPAAAAAFVARVGSSCTLVNASTRFNDGFQLGLGAEIGISTSRVHAYGPMGLEELTTQRYIVHGTGQVRG